MPRENPAGGKGCGRGALFGFCKYLDQAFLSWGAKNGQEQPVLLVEGTCCCFEQHRAFSVSGEMQGFNRPIAALRQKNYPGSEVQTII